MLARGTKKGFFLLGVAVIMFALISPLAYLSPPLYDPVFLRNKALFLAESAIKCPPEEYNEKIGDFHLEAKSEKVGKLIRVVSRAYGRIADVSVEVVFSSDCRKLIWRIINGEEHLKGKF